MFTDKELAQGKRRARNTAKTVRYRAFLVVRGSELVCTLVLQCGDVPILRAGLDYPLYPPPPTCRSGRLLQSPLADQLRTAAIGSRGSRPRALN